jgi:hypothetical protein
MRAKEPYSSALCIGLSALIQAQWKWLLDHGFDDLEPLVGAVHAQLALRRPTSSVSIGPPDDAAGPAWRRWSA